MKTGRNNPLISVIIPVYNTKNYLRRCLDSVSKQTYSNLEIICIDDGSSDGSQIIVDEFASRDARFKVLHKQNEGESSARNAGLRMATGDYWTFVDCDDWLEKNMYEELVDKIRKYHVDVVASAWYKDDEYNSIKIENVLPVCTTVIDKETLLMYVYKRDYYRGFSYMWNKLYRRELFLDNEGKLILFPEDLELGGDVYYLARLVLNTNTAVYVDTAFYHYIQRETSGVHTKSLKKRMDWLEAYKRVITYIEVNEIETEALLWIKRFLGYHSSNVAEMAYEQKNAEVLKACQRLMQRYYKEYCTTNQEYIDRIDRYNRILDYNLED